MVDISNYLCYNKDTPRKVLNTELSYYKQLSSYDDMLCARQRAFGMVEFAIVVAPEEFHAIVDLWDNKYRERFGF